MPRIAVGIIAAAFAGIIGFACGALLSKPSIVATDARIKVVEDSKEILLKETEKTKEMLSIEQSKNESINKSMEKLKQENINLRRQAAQLKNVNALLNETVSELESLKDLLIEKALK